MVLSNFHAKEHNFDPHYTIPKQEWRGDWGDHSTLWTRRRRARLGLVKNDRDNAFWMSFNDFCVVFRSLYVCRWYDPR